MRDLRARSLKKACFIAALFSMMLSAAPAFAQTVTAMWDPSPSTDQVTSYQVCVGTSSLSCNVALASVGASTTAYTFAPTGGVRYYLAIRANNAAGSSPFSSEVSFSIPSLAQPANQSGTAGVAISPLTLSITDPDGSPLTITHTGLPLGLSINSSTRQITGTPTSPGTFNVTVFVNDGLATVQRSFTWAVAGPDLAAPFITISSHTADQTVTTSSVTISDSGAPFRSMYVETMCSPSSTHFPDLRRSRDDAISAAASRRRGLLREVTCCTRRRPRVGFAAGR